MFGIISVRLILFLDNDRSDIYISIIDFPMSPFGFTNTCDFPFLSE